MKPYIRIFLLVYAIVIGINISFHYIEYSQGNTYQIISYFEFCTVTTLLAWSGYFVLDKFVFKRYFKWRENPVLYVLTAFLLTCAYSAVLMFFYTMAQWLSIPHGKLTFMAYYIHNTVYNIFITIICLLFGFGGKFLMQWKKSLDDNDRIRQQMLISQFELLKSQVNPHFLYNSLNTLTTIIPTDPDKAIDFVQQLSRVFRYSLQYAEENTIDVATELNIVRSYLFLNQQRFGDKFVAELDVTDEIMNRHLITQVLLMLVENAIKHNEISKNRPLHLRIYSPDEATLVVENSLQPKALAEKSTKVGLANIISRYKLVTDLPVSVEKNNEKFTVTIPLLA